MARTARVIEIPSLGVLDRAAGDLSRQLAQALRNAVRRGDVRPGRHVNSGIRENRYGIKTRKRRRYDRTRKRRMKNGSPSF
ncbi:hypothetical protein F7R13_28355, partial [Burkholderia territorii]